MTPKKFPENPRFFYLGAGNNPNTNGMHVTIVHDPEVDKAVDSHNEGKPPEQQQGKPVFVVSCWEMTPEEREHFLKTGEIWVAIMASPQYPTQPPIFVTPADVLDLGFKTWEQPPAKERRIIHPKDATNAADPT